MATRCMICFEDGNERVNVYQHFDGYPSYVLPVLARVVRAFQERVGWDPEYMAARSMLALMKEADENLDSWAPENGDLLGFGICASMRGDLRYIYRVSRNESGIFMLHVYHRGSRLTDNDEAVALAQGEIPERFRSQR